MQSPASRAPKREGRRWQPDLIDVGAAFWRPIQREAFSGQRVSSGLLISAVMFTVAQW